jgi:hypothetical protein
LAVGESKIVGRPFPFSKNSAVSSNMAGSSAATKRLAALPALVAGGYFSYWLPPAFAPIWQIGRVLQEGARLAEI